MTSFQQKRLSKKSKSIVGGRFGDHEYLAICPKWYIPQKNCLKMCDHPKKILCPKYGVLVAGSILLSVGSIISHKKDCHKICDHPKNSKSQVGGSFGGHENLAICKECYFPHKRLPQNM